MSSTIPTPDNPDVTGRPSDPAPLNDPNLPDPGRTPDPGPHSPDEPDDPTNPGSIEPL